MSATVDLSDDGRAARWRASRGDAMFACQRCWQGMKTAGSCTTCGSRLVVAARQASTESEMAHGLPPQPARDSWITFPQQEWLNAHKARIAAGLPGLVPVNDRQHALLEGRNPCAP